MTGTAMIEFLTLTKDFLGILFVNLFIVLGIGFVLVCMWVGLMYFIDFIKDPPRI